MIYKYKKNDPYCLENKNWKTIKITNVQEKKQKQNRKEEKRVRKEKRKKENSSIVESEK